MRDPHQILGVPWNADPRHIRAAYRKRAAELHPDRNPAPDAADRLKEVIDAYRFLSNPTRYVQASDQFQAPAATNAAAVNTAEFRRQQTFWYHFQKLISPGRSRWHPTHETRAKLAICLGIAMILLALLAPTADRWRMPDTSFDTFIVIGLILASTVVVVVPHLFAEIPVYTNRRGLEPDVPEWLVESYGWIGLLCMLAIMMISSGFLV